MSTRKTKDGGLLVCLILGTMLLGAARLSAQAQNFFGPPEAAVILNGPGLLVPPFGTSGAARFQQVYSSAGFSDLVPSGGGFIQAICFRLDPMGAGFDVTIPSIQLNFSTTSRMPDGLSGTFADNVGTDDTAVLGPQSVRVVGAEGSFSTCFIFLDQPFYYNPQNGNLLLDLRIYQGTGGEPARSPLDAFVSIGDSVSSVLGFGNGSLPTVGQTSTLGLATEFSITPVPEPSTWALMAVGMGVVAVGWKRRRKHKEGRDAAG